MRESAIIRELVIVRGDVDAVCVAGLDRPNTALARITKPIPVNSNATPTMLLKIASISDMNPMSSAVAESRFRDPDVAGAVRDRLAVIVLRRRSLVVRPHWVARILG